MPDFLVMGTAKLYGLVGRNIAYSFSRAYFTEKFAASGIVEAEYVNFDIGDISEFVEIIAQPNLKGLNVTIPYKEAIIPLLDKMSDAARKIGAVNTIKIHDDKTLEGFNTDVFGFRHSLEPMLGPNHKQALILGTGGASKAVAFALDSLGISYRFVSRNADGKSIGYKSLSEETLENYQIVINTTPLGTFPNVESCPEIPYHHFTPSHIAFDLVYNPSESKFLNNAKKYGAVIKNGLEMLQLQAEKSWEIWND